MPVVVDAGVEQYTKLTFGKQRYTIWTMQSGYHNTPGINGADQQAGAEYKASDVAFSDDGRRVRFSLDMAGAYGVEAALLSYRRELVLNRGGEIELTDTYTLKEWKAPLVLNLLCYERPGIAGSRISLGSGTVLLFDAEAWDAEVEVIPLSDSKLRGDWKKDELFRLRLRQRGKELAGVLRLRFTGE
jgi:hypothetical protein